MANYFENKISKINYKIATHEGAANERLASQVNNLLLLPQSEVPTEYQDLFNELMAIVEKTVSDLPGLMIPVRLQGIQNRTAIKYIKLLIALETHFVERDQ